MLKRLANFIVDRRKAILIAFLALTAAAVAGIFFVRINYDLSKYLPEDAETTRAMNIMNKEFGDGGALTVMAEIDAGVGSAEEDARLKRRIAGALELKNRIADEAASIAELESFLEAMRQSRHYRSVDASYTDAGGGSVLFKMDCMAFRPGEYLRGG